MKCIVGADIANSRKYRGYRVSPGYQMIKIVAGHWWNVRIVYSIHNFILLKPNISVQLKG
jgi:hypothetical protein